MLLQVLAESLMHPSMINMTTTGHCSSAIFVTAIVFLFIYQKLFYFTFTINLTTKISQGGWVVWCDWHVLVHMVLKKKPYIDALNLSSIIAKRLTRGFPSTIPPNTANNIIHAKRISPVQYLYGPWMGIGCHRVHQGGQAWTYQFDTLLNLHHYVTIKH